jgi:hypothetical protein
MSSEYIADYRNRAGECFARAKTAKDSELKTLWLALAERWQLLAEFVEKSEAQSAIKLGDRADKSKERAPSSRRDQQDQPSHADHHQQD